MSTASKYGVRLLIILLWCASSTVRAQWFGSTIDTLTRDTFRDELDKQSLAVDDSNTLHAVWKRARPGGGWRLFYSKKPAAGIWTSPQEIADSALLIFRYALTVNPSSATPYVAYERESALPAEIILAEDSSGTWLHTRITENVTDDLSPSIVLDANGIIHLAWIGKDISNNWKIRYGTNLAGSWQTQLLSGSELGPFGSGAEPFIAVTPSGRAHVFYRGGDFGTYHIHHAWNEAPGDTTWNYQIVSTPNANDFTACAIITPDTTIHLLASGNDGFGFPPRAFYLKKLFGGNWTAPQRANPSGSGWGGSLFIDPYGAAHITWDEVSGNIYTGNLYYASNTSGTWTEAALLADGKTYSGVLALDGQGKGHALAFNGESFSTQEILAIHSPGTLTSVWKSPIAPETDFRLFQNYPNPFNPTTLIRYHLPFGDMVSLKVYTSIGQEVATLVHGIIPPGIHTVNFDGSRLPAGMYVCRLQAGTSVSSRKMLLLK